MTRAVPVDTPISRLLFLLVNHYSYSDYLAYDERPHIHVGYPTPEPVSAPVSTYMTRYPPEKEKEKKPIPGTMRKWIEEDNKSMNILGIRWLLKEDRRGKAASSLVIYLKDMIEVEHCRWVGGFSAPHVMTGIVDMGVRCLQRFCRVFVHLQFTFTCAIGSPAMCYIDA